MGNLYKDYYIILEVHYLASQAIIKSSYKQLSKIYHPDIGGNVEKFHILDFKQAYRLVLEYLEAFYNTKRIHSHCDYMSPNDFEKLYEQSQEGNLLLAS